MSVNGTVHKLDGTTIHSRFWTEIETNLLRLSNKNINCQSFCRHFNGADWGFFFNCLLLKEMPSLQSLQLWYLIKYVEVTDVMQKSNFQFINMLKK